jgi:hypothetical protein
VAAVLLAALSACATAERREFRLPPPSLPAPASPIERVPLSIGTSVEPVQPLQIGGAGGTELWTLPLEEPIRTAFGEVAAALSSVDPAPASSVAAAVTDATLRVRKLSLDLVPPARIELATALVTRQGVTLASVTRTGWGPAVERPRERRVPADVAAELSAAIASAAARTRDALAIAPEVAALRPAPAPAGAGAGAAPPGTAAEPRPRITEFWDLRWAADRDPVVAERVEVLASRRSTGRTLAGAGAVSLLAAALAAIPRTECAFGVCSDHPVSHPEVAAVFGVVSAALLVAAIAVWPAGGGVREGVDLWNRRHPDQPLEVAPAPPADPDGRAPMTVP